MKDFIICLGIWLLVAGQAFGQKAMIKGQVSSAKNEPVVGANVVLKGTVRGVQTNAQGEYIIKGLSSGTYTIEVSFLGFKNKTISVDLADNQTPVFNFLLETEDLTLGEVTVFT